MKTIITFFIFTFFAFVLSGCGNLNNSTNNNSNANLNNTNNIENSENTSQHNDVTVDISRTSTDVKNVLDNFRKLPKETELSSFATPLKSGVANRITNIKITSNKINGYVLKNGETFSFNEIIGPCTAEEGYQEAEIYVNKEIKFALGGGNCQVSTTLYNAALAVPGITIVERHEHGRNVDYIEDGKDATVSYNTLDLKFKNDTGKDIKLYTWCDDVNVYAKISSID